MKPWFENHQAVYRNEGDRYVIDRRKLTPEEERRLFGEHSRPRHVNRWVAYDWEKKRFSCYGDRSMALIKARLLIPDPLPRGPRRS